MHDIAEDTRTISGFDGDWRRSSLCGMMHRTLADSSSGSYDRVASRLPIRIRATTLFIAHGLPRNP